MFFWFYSAATVSLNLEDWSGSTAPSAMAYNLSLLSFSFLSRQNLEEGYTVTRSYVQFCQLLGIYYANEFISPGAGYVIHGAYCASPCITGLFGLPLSLLL